MRIVTRGDMDGLTGAVIVALNETVDGIELIHPQDITSGSADEAVPAKSQFVPEPDSRHGELWTIREQNYLEATFQGFLEHAALMTGRKPGAVFYRVRDKVLKGEM